MLCVVPCGGYVLQFLPFVPPWFPSYVLSVVSRLCRWPLACVMVWPFGCCLCHVSFWYFPSHKLLPSPDVSYPKVPLVLSCHVASCGSACRLCSQVSSVSYPLAPRVFHGALLLCVVPCVGLLTLVRCVFHGAKLRCARFPVYSRFPCRFVWFRVSDMLSCPLR